MSNPLKQIVRFIILILVQAFILSYMKPLHRFITPYVYFLFLLWLPFNIGRYTLLIAGFITGFALDMFLKTPGLHASACVMVAYMRPFIINLIVPRDTKDLSSGSPGRRTMGFTSFLIYVFILTLFHHGVLVLIEWMQFAGFLYFMGKVLLSTLVSMVLILIAELLFHTSGGKSKI
jgi:hypothetical protein